MEETLLAHSDRKSLENQHSNEKLDYDENLTRASRSDTGTQNLDVAEQKLRAVRKALCQIEIHTQRCRLDFESRQKTLTDRIKRIQESSLYVDDAQRDSAYKTQSELLASTRRLISVGLHHSLISTFEHQHQHHRYTVRRSKQTKHDEETQRRG